MSQIPIQVILLPLLAIAFAVYTLMQRKRAVTQQDQQYSNYRAAELAQRLGLQLREGDPTFNLFITQANVDVARGPSDGAPVHVQISMLGEPQGVPLELRYLYRVERETGIGSTRWSTWFDCRMTAQARQPFPPFEVTSRNTPLGSIARTQPYSALATGNPAVDANYLVATAEPGLAELLGRVLPAFDVFANAGVHLVGDGQSVSFVMSQNKPPLLGSALYYAETMSQQLSELARRLGG